MIRSHVCAAALLIAALGCGKKNDESTDKPTNKPASSAAMSKPMMATSSAPASMPASSAAAEAAPTDPQIAHIAVTANQIDVDAGKLAQTKTKNPDVKAFADLMVKDHGSVIEKATALAKKLNVTPEDNAVSKSLLADAQKNMDDLKKKDGADFDKAYVAHEVAYHQAVLDALDKVLIPNAKNADLKGLLTAVRPVVAEHLDHAKMLQSKLK